MSTVGIRTDAGTCEKRGGVYANGKCYPNPDVLEKSRRSNELWSDFMNGVWYPAPAHKKEVMLKRMMISYWQMHGTKLRLEKE